jgi:ribosome-binding factor A
MADPTRLRRIGEQIRIELAKLLLNDINDRRLAFVSITYIEVARDLSHSKVFFTYIGDAAERVEIKGLLNESAKEYRYQLAQRLKLRAMPSLTFRYDESIEKGADLQSKIEKLSKELSADLDD